MNDVFKHYGIEHLSPSSINTYIKSPARWIIRYLYKKQLPGSPAMWRGNVVDKAVGYYFGMMPNQKSKRSLTKVQTDALDQFDYLRRDDKANGFETDQDKFDKAADVLDQVINQGRYALFNDYKSLFFVANENNAETVFDVEYSGAEGGSYGCLICLEGNAAPGFHGIRQYNGPVYGDGNSYNLPTQNLYDAFDATDVRRDATCLDIDAFIAKQPNSGNIKYAKGAGGHTGFYNNKYIKRQGEIGLPDNDLTSPVNYRVIRYADVLLMSAEAHARSNSPDYSKALGYLNQVRNRVNMPALSSTGNQLIEDIWNERRLELSGEGHRFFDLVRTGKAADAISGFVVGKHELFPIPRVEIDLAGGTWKQNNNY